MYLVYIDEVKYNPPEEQFYWLVGLAIPEEDINSLESALTGLATDFFGNASLDPMCEFHAADIVQGKASCKGRDLDDRVGLFTALTNVVSNHANVGRIVIRLDPQQMSRTDYHRIAFMYLVERVNDLMRARNSRALLIADHDKDTVWPNVRSLAAYRESGTDWAYGREIDRVVDTIHHTHSAQSRLLQLTDVYAYSMSLHGKRGLRHPKSAIVAHIQQLPHFTWPTKSKYWPGDA